MTDEKMNPQQQWFLDGCKPMPSAGFSGQQIARYDPDLLASIPPEIWAAAEKVADYFDQRSPGHWTFGRIQSRS